MHMICIGGMHIVYIGGMHIVGMHIYSRQWLCMLTVAALNPCLE